MSIQRALYQLLKTTPVPGNRIYALRAPQNVTAPFVVYQRIAGERDHHLKGASGIVQARFLIDVYDREYHASRLLAADIEDVLDGYSGIVAFGNDSPQETIKVAAITCQSDVDLMDESDEPFLYRVSTDYLITYHQE